MNKKLFRITTVPVSLRGLLKGQLKFMSENGYEVTGISSYGEALFEVEKNEGIKVIPVEMTRIISPFKDLKALWILYRYFRKEKPFIVHTHTPKAGIVGMLAAKLAKVPNRLHTVAGLPLLEAQGMKRTLLNFVEKITYKCATHVYPNSFNLKNIIIEEKLCSSKKLKVLANGSSNGIDTTHFSLSQISDNTKTELKENLNIKANDVVFCFIGRLVKDKGINELVAAFSQLSLEEPKEILNLQLSIKLLLVGRFERELDPLLPETEKEIQNNPNIIFVGYQKDVRPYLAISDIFVFPSYREGLPNVVMQAGAMELPSIVTDINGCNEIIENGVNGLIIPSKNIEILKEKMLLLLENLEIRNKLKSNAREMITSRYEQKVVWEALLAEYKSLENNVQNPH